MHVLTVIEGTGIAATQTDVFLKDDLSPQIMIVP